MSTSLPTSISDFFPPLRRFAQTKAAGFLRAFWGPAAWRVTFGWAEARGMAKASNSLFASHWMRRHRKVPERLRLEALEGRCLPATFFVTTTADAGPGSLRRAILDANASPGHDEIRFDIPTSDPGFTAARPVGSQWWVIRLERALPAITEGVQILGFSQTALRGDTNVGVVGTGGTVGVDAVPLPQFPRPEIAIDAGQRDGLVIGGAASDVLIEGLAIYNARHGIRALGGLGTNRVVQWNLLGTLPDGSDPGALRTTRDGVRVEADGSLVVRHNYVGYNGQVGIDGVRDTSVLDALFNEVFQNGWADNDHDGIDLNGINGSAKFNLVRDNVNHMSVLAGRPRPHHASGHGIELGSIEAGRGGNVVENNTVRNNVSAGIAVRNGSTGNTIRKNVVTGNSGGVWVHIENSSVTERNTISENSIFDNASLGIDLQGDILSSLFDGATLNDPGDTDTGSNTLLNYPVITRSVIAGGRWIVEGFAEAGSVIEIFEAAPDSSGFGEGRRHLVTVTEGSSDDQDAGVGRYGPLLDGLLVSTAAVTAPRFRFVLPVPAGVGVGTLITATATLDGNTSEFGPTRRVGAGAGIIRGRVYVDLNRDGDDEGGAEPGIAGVKIILSGRDDLGRRIRRLVRTSSTGVFELRGLRSGLYALREIQPADFADGRETVGTLGGDASLNDLIRRIPLPPGGLGENYLFGEFRRPPNLPDCTAFVFPRTPQRLKCRFLSSETFDPGRLDAQSFRLEGIGPVSVRRGDLNRDGVADLALFFRASQLRLSPNQRTARLEGRTVDGELVVFDVPIILPR
jgi:parallel beta-helix repeat protein